MPCIMKAGGRGGTWAVMKGHGSKMKGHSSRLQLHDCCNFAVLKHHAQFGSGVTRLGNAHMCEQSQRTTPTPT